MASSFYEYRSAILAERFHSLENLGCGPHGRVYRAYDEKMDSVIAVKRLEMASFAQEEKLKREVMDIKRVRHVSLAAKKKKHCLVVWALLTMDSATSYPSTTRSSVQE